MICSKNRLFVGFFSHSGVMVIFKLPFVTVELNDGNLRQSCGAGRFKIRLRLLRVSRMPTPTPAFGILRSETQAFKCLRPHSRLFMRQASVLQSIQLLSRPNTG